MTTVFFLCIVLIIYVYVGYPLTVWLLAQFSSRKNVTASNESLSDYPTVTLLIAAYNEEACIAEKLENTLQSRFPADRLQILVAADGSDDDTARIVRSFRDRGVELSYRPQRQGKMKAINRAVSKARGEIILFSDANNFYAPETIHELIFPFAIDNVGAVTGAKTIQSGDGALGESEGLYWKYESWIKQQETRLGCCTGVAGEILAIRRELFEPAPAGIINDDFYMMLRIIARGYNVIYVPTARSTERVSETAQDEITRRSRIVAGRYQSLCLAPRLLSWRRPRIIWQIISHKYMRPLVPLFMLGALITNGLILLQGASSVQLFQIIFIGQMLFYSAAWLGNRRETGGIWGRILYLPTFLFNSNWAALMGLAGYLSGGQTALWQRAARRS